jgi:hypothetical protein
VPRSVSLVDTFEAETVGSDTTHVEARRRNDVPQPWLAREIAVNYAEDDGELRYAIDVVHVALRHPLRTASALRRARASLRTLCAIAPTAKRLGRAAKLAVRWEVEASRRADAELVRRLLDAPEAPSVDASQKAPSRSV